MVPNKTVVSIGQSIHKTIADFKDKDLVTGQLKPSSFALSNDSWQHASLNLLHCYDHVGELSAWKEQVDSADMQTLMKGVAVCVTWDSGRSGDERVGGLRRIPMVKKHLPSLSSKCLLEVKASPQRGSATAERSFLPVNYAPSAR